MLRLRTLFVVGAGANADFELPLGPVLAEQICKLMPTSGQLENTEFGRHLSRLSTRAEDRNEIYFAAQNIRKNLPLSASIDSYLDTHRDCEWRVYVAHHRGENLTVTSLCYGAGVPLSTGTRHLQRLEDHGLVAREEDESDMPPRTISGMQKIAHMLLEDWKAFATAALPLGKELRAT